MLGEFLLKNLKEKAARSPKSGGHFATRQFDNSKFTPRVAATAGGGGSLKSTAGASGPGGASGRKFSNSKITVVCIGEQDNNCVAYLKQGFNIDVIKSFKCIPGYRYDPNTKYWTFGLDKQVQLSSLLRQVNGIEVVSQQ
ncbi:MAG: hypothetical protein MHMPM18_003533 [Marteilia pararefringens]